MSYEWMVQLREELNRIAAWTPTEDGARVTTHCMYPSNGLVDVVVRVGRHSAVVSDDGGAMSEAMSAGINISPNDLAASAPSFVTRSRDQERHYFRSASAACRGAGYYSACRKRGQDVAAWRYDHAKVKRHRDFRKALGDLLSRTFEERLTRNAVVAGKRKQHTFANVIILPSEDLLIVDPVSREPSSINARVVSNLDVAQAENPKIRQRLVYDDEDEWTPQDLGLLGIVGVPIVPFSRSPQVIRRIGARRLGYAVASHNPPELARLGYSSLKGVGTKLVYLWRAGGGLEPASSEN